jgi:hypothetical protein
MKKVDLEILLYLEGYRVPIKSYSITAAKNNLTVATINLPSTDEIAEIVPGTVAEIFYWDNYASVYRLAFNGRISSPIYNKSGGFRSRGLTAVSHASILNELPTKYLYALEDMDFYQITDSYNFYHMPVDEAIEAYKNQLFSKYTLFDEINKSETTIVKYFDKFLDIIKNCWEPFYRNQEKQLKITKDHIFFDDGLFKRFYKSQALYNFLENMNYNIASSNRTILDTILSEIRKVGYAYFSINSPAYNNFGKNDDNIGDAGDTTIRVNKDSLAQFVLMPEVINANPPRCNVLVSGIDSTLNAAMSPQNLTRLRYAFKFFDNLGYNEDYPEELSKNDYKFTDAEKRIGLKAHIGSKSYLFHQIMGEALLTPEDKDKDEIRDIYKKVTKYDYLKAQYASNRVKIVAPEYIPYIVAGLPGLIIDTTSRTIYYGTIEDYSVTIDQNAGNTGTQITMTNAREIKSIDDIGELNPFLMQKIFGGANIADNCYQYLLKGTSQIASNCSADQLRAYYEALDKNENFIQREINLLTMRQENTYDGYNAITELDGLTDLSEIKKKFKDDQLNRREIATFGEYYTAKGYLQPTSGAIETYNRKYSSIINDILSGNTDLEITFDEFSEGIIDKKAFYIKERRDAIRNLLLAYRNRIME